MLLHRNNTRVVLIMVALVTLLALMNLTAYAADCVGVPIPICP